LRRCDARPELRFDARCACGFDGERAPVESELAALDGLRGRVEEGLRAFFGQPSVRARLREAVKLGILPAEDARPAMGGGGGWPEVRDAGALGAHLAGADVVAAVPAGRLLERVCGRTWSRDDLVSAVAAWVQDLPQERVRVVAEDDADVAAWATRVALRHGEPLPAGLVGRHAEVEPEDVGPAGLARLDALRLGSAVVARVLGWIVEGRLEATRGVSALVDGALELVEPTVPTTAEALAGLAACLYGCDPVMRGVAPERWAVRLLDLARTPLDLPSHREALEEHADRAWWVIDGLGLPLWEAVRDALPAVLPGWEVVQTSFARSAARSTTAAFQDMLLGAGLVRAFDKMDAIDRLLHERAPPFPDLVRFALSELHPAGRALLRRLEGRRELVVTADHGFRLDGRGYVHGGDTTLERVVPVVVMRRR
jgi:hypothetical protein